MIPVYRPHLPPESLRYAQDALAKGDLANGFYKESFASRFASMLGVRHVIPVCNGTAATHLIFKALEFRHPQVKRLIFPNNSYVAVYNAALFDFHSWDLIALDAKLDSWNANYDLAHHFTTLDETTAFVIVHNLGNTVNVPELKRQYPKCVFVEDACEALFGRHEASFAGTESLCASFSFYGNKTLTCGEGGAFVTNDTELFEWISRVYSQGQTSEKFVHDVLAYNYRMSNLSAAALCGQLDFVEEIQSKKKDIFDIYRNELWPNTEGVYLPFFERGCRPANWMFGLRVEGGNSRSIREKLSALGIETRPMFYPITRHNHLRAAFEVVDTSVAEKLSNECVVLPSFPDLKFSEIEYICNAVKKVIA